jgi:hypothetical protein
MPDNITSSPKPLQNVVKVEGEEPLFKAGDGQNSQPLSDRALPHA